MAFETCRPQACRAHGGASQRRLHPGRGGHASGAGVARNVVARGEAGSGRALAWQESLGDSQPGTGLPGWDEMINE